MDAGVFRFGEEGDMGTRQATFQDREYRGGEYDVTQTGEPDDEDARGQAFPVLQMGARVSASLLITSPESFRRIVRL